MSSTKKNGGGKTASDRGDAPARGKSPASSKAEKARHAEKKAAPRPVAAAVGAAGPSDATAVDLRLLPAARRPLVATLVWLGLTLITALLTGCPRFDLSYALYLVFTLALVASELAFLDALYRKGKRSLLLAWKKFSGYSLVLCYVFQALPRAGWRNSGLINEGRTAFIYALSLICLAAGLVAFVLASRPASLAAFGVITEEEVHDKALRKRNRAQRQKPGFLRSLLEWVDAIAFAAIAVIIIEIFVFQLYVIPSESMVPGFLINDRPFTVKLTMGPRLPLTEWRLPFIDPPKRGDIVTISNPRYPENREVNVKKQLSQFVYMLTFTAVNLDQYLPDGSPKYDPLVKRVVGVPGDKLMMLDDVLYAKRKGDADFKPVEDDKKWARVDLWKEDTVPLSKIRTMPIDERGRALLSAWDARKNGADIARLGQALGEAATRVEVKAAQARGRAQPLPSSEIAALRDEAIRGASANGAAFIAEDLSLALAAIRTPAVAQAIAAYARDGEAASRIVPADAYERGSRALDLLIKTNLVSRIERDLDLFAAGAPFDSVGRDAALTRLQAEASELRNYVLFYDTRNFPVFPAGDAYLGPEEYFAMGDNRYNSLDFRFQEGWAARALDSGDPSSVQYRSNLAPFALERKYIESKAKFILWPVSRMGAIKQ
jgi:signal peptidase I